MTRLRFAFVLVPLLMVSTAGLADYYEYTAPDLSPMYHSKAYTWGIDRTWSDLEVVQGATLYITGLRDYTSNDRLYISLLDEAPLGVTTLSDPVSGNSDYFAGQGTPLLTLANIPSYPKTDIAYQLTADEIEALNSYASNWRFAVAFDPDCQYYTDCAIKFGVCTTAIPEPTAMAFLAVGGGLLALRRNRRNRKVALET